MPPSSPTADLFGTFTLHALLAQSAVALAVTLAVVVGATFALRALRARDKAREVGLRWRWRPLLAAARPQSELPRPSAEEARGLLTLLDEMHTEADPRSSRRLARAEEHLGLRDAALAMFLRGTMRERLIAARALGRMRSRHAWPWLEDATRSPSPTLALAAAEAMVNIDPEVAMRSLGSLLTQGTAWAPAAVARILDRAGDHARPVLAWLFAESAQSLRLIHLLSQAGNTSVTALLRLRLGTSNDPQEVGEALAALGRLGSVEDRPRMLAHLKHPEWVVRLKAAQALGEVGTTEDAAALVALLSDHVWWVRYRAAQALAALPGSTPQRLREIRSNLGDRYARDMVAQVLAEMGAE